MRFHPSSAPVGDSHVLPLEQRIAFAAATAFAALVDNPYFPVVPGMAYVYRGIDTGDGANLLQRVNVLTTPAEIDGVTTTAVRERLYRDGVLAEDDRVYYAQDKAGNVWSFGKDARTIENGAVSSTAGSWQAGVDNARPGLVMKAAPAGLDTYTGPPGPGGDRVQMTVTSTNEAGRVPFGNFGSATLITETDPQHPNDHALKLYAPGIGLLLSNQTQVGNQILRLGYVLPGPQAFGDTIDNPYLPLIPGTTFIYQGTDGEAVLTERFAVTDLTADIDGVTTTMVRDRVYEDGELIEDTRDYFAQDKIGNVWYFGEDSRDIEAGQVVGTAGSWRAGVNGALPGIVMKAVAARGDTYSQETAVGVAQDRAAVVGLDGSATVPFGTFHNALRTLESTPLEPDALERKTYAPGFGLVLSEELTGGAEVLRLVDVLFE